MNDSPHELPPISDRSGVTDAVRVQILATEHWDLLATRSMTWNQIFSRASMFITLLSAVVVALALVAQATHFDDRFRLFALLLLPIVFILGIATFIHLGEANGDDVGYINGMKQLRRAYLELAPELQPYFPAVHLDGNTGIPQPIAPNYGYTLIHFLGATPAIVGTMNVVVAGVISALIADAFGLPITTNVIIGVICAVIVGLMHAFVVLQRVTSLRREMDL